LRSDIDHPAPGIKHMNFQISYLLSRFENDVPIGLSFIQGDQDAGAVAPDYRNPRGFSVRLGRIVLISCRSGQSSTWLEVSSLVR